MINNSALVPKGTEYLFQNPKSSALTQDYNFRFIIENDDKSKIISFSQFGATFTFRNLESFREFLWKFSTTKLINGLRLSDDSCRKTEVPKMATTKQAKYICVLKKDLGEKPEYDKYIELSDDSASAYIDELLDKKVKMNGDKKPKQQELKQATVEIDGVGFGLCFKKTCDYFFAGDNPEWGTDEIFTKQLNRMVERYVENRQRLVGD